MYASNLPYNSIDEGMRHRMEIEREQLERECQRLSSLRNALLKYDLPESKDVINQSLVREVLNAIGEDPNREGLKETPARVVASWKELFSGYSVSPNDVGELLKTFEDGAGGCDEMVVVKGIEFYSMCEHHMLPFVGVAHVGYLPDGKIVGLSKLARLVNVYARRLQVQERMTSQIVRSLEWHLKPRGAGCVVEARHLCMACRGVKSDSVTITSKLLGAFKDDPKTRGEFLSLVHSK